MLYKYPCGCVGLAPDGHEQGPLIVMACDSENDELPSRLSQVVAYRRHMKDPDERVPLSDEGVQDFFQRVGELKQLAYMGQGFIRLTLRAQRIVEQRRAKR